MLHEDCRGSVMVEVALIVPAIMFLLLAGVTLAHIVQLSRAADRAAAVLADDFSQRTSLEETDFDIALMAASELIDTGGFEVTPWLSITAVEMHPVSGATTIWNRSRNGGAGDCTGADPAYSAPVGAADGGGILHLVQVDLCATPGAGFFLSSALSVMDFSIHARATASARAAALRGLN